MRSMQRGIVLVLVFAIGCIAAVVVGPLLVQPARAGTGHQKWEQMCVSAQVIGLNDTARMTHKVDEPKGWNSILKKHGIEGWELVDVLVAEGRSIEGACFKRPLK